MTSLVTEVLLQAGKLDKEDLQTKISKLTLESNELKAKVDNFVKKKYHEFNPLFMSCQTLLSDISLQQEKAKDIQGTLSGVVKTQLQDSTSEFERLSDEHSQTSELLFAMERICELSSLFEKVSKNDDFVESASALLEIKAILEGIKKTYMSDLAVYKFLDQHFKLTLEGVRYDLDEKWMRDVKWILPGKDETTENAVLNIPFFEKVSDPKCENFKNFQDFIYAMSMLGRVNQKIQKFSELVMKYIFVPLINDQGLIPDFDCDENATQTYRKIQLVKASSLTSDTKYATSTPANLFKNVVKILQCLNTNLLRFKTKSNDDKDVVMLIFSKYIRDDLLQMLIDKCLALTIPKNMEELENYKVVEDVVKSFESALMSINFIPYNEEGQSGSQLLAYVTNVSSHFANQRCTDILQQARTLMKKEIHNTQLMSDKDFGDFSRILKQRKSTSELVKMPVGTGFNSQRPNKKLSDDTLRFPECHVSICAIDLMKLAYKTMQEASQSDPVCAVKLVTITQNIFDLYGTAYPIYHANSLENLPQFSAIFYNDCMYLAHHLITFGHQFSVTPNASKLLRVLTFMDKVVVLRRLGAECFLKQMSRQKDIMIQCLEPFLTFSELRGADKYEIGEKAIRQILDLLNHLKKVWTEVLQAHIFKRALCTLVNACIAELILIICTMEDISADDSISLKLYCLMLSDKIPMIFQAEGKDDIELDITWQKQVPKWHRLQELILVLSGSLREIVDRWSEGKGPLAAAFSITEVKGLIRALFQNTEHRAQAISKISVR
ncbi:centromere/kinetochore protein zw10 homolog [Styela clava]